MQNRKAVILSLGMLLEKVDVDSFILKLLKKAKENNPKFELNAEMKDRLYKAAEDFNLGRLSAVAYKEITLANLRIKDGEDFWPDWNKIITIGNIVEKFRELRLWAQEQNATLYLFSNTNKVHFRLIQEAIYEQGENLRGGSFTQIPLYLSFQHTKNHADTTPVNHWLVNKIITDIRAKQFNKPNEISLIVGSPENIKHPVHHAEKKAECQGVKSWCYKNGVSVWLHCSVLADTLAKIAAPQQVTNRLKVG